MKSWTDLPWIQPHATKQHTHSHQRLAENVTNMVSIKCDIIVQSTNNSLCPNYVHSKTHSVCPTSTSNLGPINLHNPLIWTIAQATVLKPMHGFKEILHQHMAFYRSRMVHFRTHGIWSISSWITESIIKDYFPYKPHNIPILVTDWEKMWSMWYHDNRVYLLVQELHWILGIRSRECITFDVCW